jgi:hypothetical protein
MSQVEERVDWDARWYQSFRERYPEGWVVAQHEQNMYHDSYFSETLFLADSGEFVSVQTGATAYGGPHTSGLPFLRSAPEEIKTKAVVAAATRARDLLLEQLPSQVQAVIDQRSSFANLPTVGAVVAVKWKTKGYPKGSQGQVFWQGVDKFGDGGARFGIQMEDGEKIFVNWKSLVLVQHSVDYIQPPQYEVDQKKIQAFAQGIWDRRIAAGYEGSFGGHGYGWRGYSARGFAEQQWESFVSEV